MFSSIRVASVVIALLLLPGCSVAKERQPLTEAFRQSTIISNLEGSAKPQLLRRLQHIVQAPLRTPLRVVHELQHGHAAESIREILNTYPSVGKDNMGSWLDHVGSFLETYKRGSSPFQHGSVQIVLNLTALSGLPMIRRSLLAQLTSAWLTTLGKKIPTELEPKVAHLVQQLYGIHTASVAQKGVMEYFHISKSGGTSWNGAAKLNGCIRAQSAGCHVKGFGDECRWLNQTVYKEITNGRRILWGRWGRMTRPSKYHGCKKRYDHMASRGFSYISNEYTLQGGHQDVHDAHPCPQVVNVATLRDPMRRMESNIKFVMMHVKTAYRLRVEGGEAAFDALFCNASAAFWEALGPPITDNYIVRSFLGEFGFHTPIGGITQDHVAAARDQLLQFDLVLDLDAGEVANDRLVDQGLGWPAALSLAHALDSTVLSVRMDLDYDECHPDSAGMEILKQRQVHDTNLYGFGRVVNQLDELWLDLARAIGLRPLERELDTSSRPGEIRCGMLWRGSNNSALVQAYRQVAGPITEAPAQDVNADASQEDEGEDGLDGVDPVA